MSYQSAVGSGTISKIWGMLTSSEKRRGVALLGLMLIGMVLETLGVGLVIPAIALLTQRESATKYPALQWALQMVGNPKNMVLINI